MTAPEKRTPAGGAPDSGGVIRRYLGWALFGAFGIGVAVGIALVAGQLASQPVGITGEPVSVTASLASPRDGSASRSDRADRTKKGDDRRARSREVVSEPTPAAVAEPVWTTPARSNSDSGYTESAGSGGSVPPVSGGSGNSGSDKDYDSDYGHDDDSYEEEEDDYEDDD